MKNINLNRCRINLTLDWRGKYENWMVHILVVKSWATLGIPLGCNIWVLMLVSLKRMSSMVTSILENLALFASNNSLKDIGVQSKFLGGKEWMRRTSPLSLVWMKKQHEEVNLGMKKYMKNLIMHYKNPQECYNLHVQRGLTFFVGSKGRTNFNTRLQTI
jgi:hypothetical protein